MNTYRNVTDSVINPDFDISSVSFDTTENSSATLNRHKNVVWYRTRVKVHHPGHTLGFRQKDQ